MGFFSIRRGAGGVGGDPAQWVPLEPDLLRKIERFQITRSVSSLGWLVPILCRYSPKKPHLTGGGQDSGHDETRTVVNSM